MKRSNLGGFLVKPSPTKHAFVTILFHAFPEGEKQMVIKALLVIKSYKTITVWHVLLVLPVLTTLKTSASLCALTLGIGTSHLPWKTKTRVMTVLLIISFCTVRSLWSHTAFSLRFCLIMLDRTFARLCSSLSRRYAGTAPSDTLSFDFVFVFRSSCILSLKMDRMLP